ncbi:hypothetical protein [Haloprofundus salinisoli]|uniref:hypothetical protein n=1 Tax=Haloprofundus salinisoli TaxID=2876193 RepID=UPI001CCC7430|nr:hypothetical protein [Haloprofundus salinisoli]
MSERETTDRSAETDEAETDADARTVNDAETAPQFGRKWRLLLLAMLGFVVVTTLLQFQVEGASALPEIAVSLYVVAVVGYGVVADAMRTSRFRIALYLGAVAWGAVRFVGGDTTLVTYALLVFGAFLLTRELTFPNG